jgi:hypothetical protein
MTSTILIKFVKLKYNSSLYLAEDEYIEKNMSGRGKHKSSSTHIVCSSPAPRVYGLTWIDSHDQIDLHDTVPASHKQEGVVTRKCYIQLRIISAFPT